MESRDADSLVMPCMDEVSNILLDIVPYLSHMPTKFTSATTGDPDAEDVLHFPSPEFLTYIAENIVVPFLVSLAANDVYRRLLAWRRELQSHEELTTIRHKTLKKTTRLSLRMNLKRGEMDVMRDAETRVEQILYEYGVPQREATEKAHEVTDRLRAAVLEEHADE